jgi:hypothetical protein
MRPGFVRYNLILSGKSYEEMRAMSSARRWSLSEYVKLALGLVSLLTEAKDSGNKMMIFTADGKPIKEIVHV